MLSKPVIGMIVGLVIGCVLGVLAVLYFELTPWFERLCAVGSAILVGQLLGATISSAFGKPHEAD